ncbi:hypothetical protein LguiB_002026 [Lonicera macranthoides]
MGSTGLGGEVTAGTAGEERGVSAGESMFIGGGERERERGVCFSEGLWERRAA